MPQPFETSIVLQFMTNMSHNYARSFPGVIIAHVYVVLHVQNVCTTFRAKIMQGPLTYDRADCV